MKEVVPPPVGQVWQGCEISSKSWTNFIQTMFFFLSLKVLTMENGTYFDGDQPRYSKPSPDLLFPLLATKVVQAPGLLLEAALLRVLALVTSSKRNHVKSNFFTSMTTETWLNPQKGTLVHLAISVRTHTVCATRERGWQGLRLDSRKHQLTGFGFSSVNRLPSSCK